MTKQRKYLGIPTYASRVASTAQIMASELLLSLNRLSDRCLELKDKGCGYLSMMFNRLTSNRTLIMTVLIVAILSIVLPDPSPKLKATPHLKHMKTFVSHISNEVKKAEVACMAVADEFNYVRQLSMRDFATETTNDYNNKRVKSECECIRATKSAPAKIVKSNGSNKEIAIMSINYTDSFNV